eukprot:3589142-Pyramimonas_sp.AAC.1
MSHTIWPFRLGNVRMSQAIWPMLVATAKAPTAMATAHAALTETMVAIADTLLSSLSALK